MATDIQDVKTAETNQPTIKPLKGYQTNCNEKDAKGKPCWGTLKIWHTAPDELKRPFPPGEVIYRCQNCWQLYHGPLYEHVHRWATRQKESEG